MSVPRELLPRDDRWREFRPLGCGGPNVISHSGWIRGKVVVISSLTIAEAPDGVGEIPQYHISVTRRGRRPLIKDIKVAFRAFGLRRIGPEEDNHHPGQARHFWLPLDPARRVDCQCKLDEDTLVEGDGYTWTNAKPGAGPCRGCELQQLFPQRLCPIHGAAAEHGGAR